MDTHQTPTPPQTPLRVSLSRARVSVKFVEQNPTSPTSCLFPVLLRVVVACRHYMQTLQVLSADDTLNPTCCATKVSFGWALRRFAKLLN